MTNLQVFSIVAVSLAFVGSLIHIIIFELVKNNSSMYRELYSLNKNFVFKNDFPPQIDLYEKCSNKRSYDVIILEDYLQKKIESEISKYDDLISKNEFVYNKYREYVKEYNKLCPQRIENQRRFKFKEIKLWIINLYEQLIFKKYKIKPLRYTKVFVKVSYTSPQGQKAYSRQHTYSYDGLKKNYDFVKKMIAQHSTRANLIRIERSKVTASLRAEVLKRDKNRCQICGATVNDGVLLHVDHIKPISKGGKTILSNLQTLCDRCNLGKSDKYDSD